MHLEQKHLERIVAGGFYNQEQPDMDLAVYFQINHSMIERVAKAWHECTVDEETALGRCVCYSCLGENYECGKFNKVAEEHYNFMPNYWNGIAHYINEKMANLI